MSVTEPARQGLGALPIAGPRPADTPASAATRRRRLGRGWQRLLSPLALLVIWQLVSTSGIISTAKLPPPTTIWHTAVQLVTKNSPAYGTLQNAILVSSERMVIGFALGGTVAVILAIIAGLSRWGENAVDPVMQMVRTLPLFGLLPLFIVWFGIGELPKIVLVAVAAAIPLYLNTFAGIRGVDARLGELGRTLELTRGETLRHIILPGALPQALVGLRQSLGLAWLALVVAEQFNANAGLGFIINQGAQFQDNNPIFVALLVYTVLGLLTDWLVRVLERRALAWRPALLTQ